MSGDTLPRRIPVSQVTERLIQQQRVHYERVLADFVGQIERLIPDSFNSTKRALIEDVRARLAADLERFERELAALAARGWRVDEPLH
jgi:hypothetical protein